MTGRTQDGLLELKLADSLDPLSLIIGADLADALCIAHLSAESVRQSLKTLEIDPNFAVGHYELGQAYEQQNFHQYEVLRIDEMPVVEVYVVPSQSNPGGIGEASTPTTAPAVANALFALTGKRVRRLPIRAEDLA